MNAIKLLTVLATAAISWFAATPSAYAWGVCGRGPWQSTASLWAGQWGAESACSCSNGQQGGVLASGSDWAYLWANGPSNGGVGFELEARTGSGEVQWVPALRENRTPATDASGSLWANAYYVPYWASGAYNYVYTERYRSVCITNLPSFTSSHTASLWAGPPWFY